MVVHFFIIKSILWCYTLILYDLPEVGGRDCPSDPYSVDIVPALLNSFLR